MTSSNCLGRGLGTVAARRRQRGCLRSQKGGTVALHLEHLCCILQLPGKLLEALPKVGEGLHATVPSVMLPGAIRKNLLHACYCPLLTQSVQDMRRDRAN